MHDVSLVAHKILAAEHLAQSATTCIYHVAQSAEDVAQSALDIAQSARDIAQNAADV